MNKMDQKKKTREEKTSETFFQSNPDAKVTTEKQVKTERPMDEQMKRTTEIPYFEFLLLLFL